MTDTVQVSRVQVDYVSNGADKAAADFAKVQHAQDGLASSAQGVAVANEKASGSVLGVQKTLDSYARKNDELSRELAKLATVESLIAKGRAQGATIQDGVTRAYENQKRRVEELREAVEKNSKATALNRNQQLELMHVSKSLFDQLAAGADPMRALLVEGGRIGDIFAMGSGGVGGTLKGIAGTLSGLLAPTLLLTGGLAGLGAAAALAFSTWESGQARLKESMNGLGRGSGATLGDLTTLARTGAAAGGLSTSEGMGLAAGFNAQGFAPDVTQGLVRQTRGFARTTGTDIDAAGETLAHAFADPVKGADDLNQSLGFLTDRVRSTIEDLEAQGQVDAARRVLSEALNKTLADTAERSFTLGHAFEEAKNGLSNFLGRIGQFIEHQVAGEGLDEKIARLTRDLASRTNPGGRGSGQFAREQQAQRADLDAALAERDRRRKSADEAAARAAAADLSLRTGAVVGAYLPGQAQADKLANDIELLSRALASPAALADMHLSPGQVGQAFGNAVVQRGNADPVLRQQQDYEIAKASAEAFSVAEKAAVEARRAELAVLRETGDVSRAAASAQLAMNEAIAQANSDARDRLDLARQNRALVGLSPYERGLQEIRNRYEGVGGLFARDAASTSEIKDAMRPVVSDLRSAGQLIVDALRGVAGTIAGSGATPAPLGNSGLLPLGGGNALARAPGNVLPMIADASQRTGMPAGVIAAIGQLENGFRLTGGTTMLGSNGRPSSAWGFGQLTNGAAADVARVVPGFSKYDPATAVFGSAEYLRILSQRHGGDLTAALNAYGGRSDYAAAIYARMGGSATGTVLPPLTAPAPLASTALASDRSALGQDVAGYNQERIEGPLKAANEALGNQVSLLGAQRASLGQSAAAIEAAAKAQELLNQYTNMDPNHRLGAAAWDQITTGVAKYRGELTDVLQRQQDFQKQQQQLVGTIDEVRSGFRDGLGTFVTDLEHGKSAGTALRDVMSSLGQKLQTMGLNMLTSGLFGGQGKAGGGLFGGLLGSLFGGLGGGGGFQGWMPKFALGGVMTAAGPMPLRKYAGGGVANAPQVALYGEGAHNEAYVPLPDGRSIPVSMKAPATRAAAPVAHHVSIAGSTVVIQGNADKDSIEQLRAELDHRDAKIERKLQRDWSSFGSNSGQYN